MRTLWHNRKSAFTLVELLVVIAIIAVLAALLLPALTRGKARAQRVECISDLQELGTAFQMFAHDHQGRFPMQTPTADGGSMEFVQAGENINGVFYFSYRHFQTLASDLVATKPLVCPTDLEREPAATFSLLQNSNVSYFVGVNADYNLPMSILAGDRNITNNGYATASLVRGAYGLRWTGEMHVFKGNILFSDTHVEELNNDDMNLSGSPLASSTFFLPPVRPTQLAGSGLPPGSPSPAPAQSGGGQGSAPSPQMAGNPGGTAGPSQPTQPAMPMRNSMAMGQTANHGGSPETITEVRAKEIGAIEDTNAPRRAAVRTADDEPEPPLLWLMGTAKSAVGGGRWWLLPLLLLLLGVYFYARLKMRQRAKEESED